MEVMQTILMYLFPIALIWFLYYNMDKASKSSRYVHKKNMRKIRGKKWV